MSRSRRVLTPPEPPRSQVIFCVRGVVTKLWSVQEEIGAQGISYSGRVIEDFPDANGTHGFVYLENAGVFTPALDCPIGTITALRSINNRGQTLTAVLIQVETSIAVYGWRTQPNFCPRRDHYQRKRHQRPQLGFREFSVRNGSPLVCCLDFYLTSIATR